MLRKDIQYFGRQCVVACDGNCRKAWGIAIRPSIHFDPNGNEVGRVVVTLKEMGPNDYSDCTKEIIGEPDKYDYDDFAYLADSELGDAPEYPGTWEGSDGKPDPDSQSPNKINKWCVRQCERSETFQLGEEIVVRDFTNRRFNIPDSQERDRQRNLAILAGQDPALLKWNPNRKAFIK